VSTARKYSSPTREADAAATRARIVDAAARLFIRDGFAATPMRAIAVEAGVSVQSVHLAGPKSGLLLAAFERTFAGDEGRHPLSERPEMAAILAEPDIEVTLTLYVAFIAAANERSAAIWNALVAAADADEQARAAASDLEARRRAEMVGGAHLLLARGLITPDTVAETADVLGFLTSPHSYVYFVIESGWSIERYRAWLRRGIERLVIA
jgi:AcrR family transcriptional regulator